VTASRLERLRAAPVDQLPFAAGGVATLVARQLILASTSWSIGMLGALAEFHRDPAEDCDGIGACIVTSRGALRLELNAQVRAVAYEMLAAHAESWHHGIALCMPQETCAMHCRRVITELGPDRDAVRPADRRDILFDLGLGAGHCDFHVRASDPAHIARLREGNGLSLFDPRHRLLDDIPRMSPHRVFESRLGRIEVYQPIAMPGGTTPEGPHTHVLPKLLRCNRPHSANVPVPPGWISCVTLYPANPVRDDQGMPKRFDAAQHAAFQSLLESFGDAQCVAIKRDVRESVLTGKTPATLGDLRQRCHRTACRVALRQMLHTDRESPHLATWRAAFDPPARAAYAHGH